jgi:TPR repeat protein
MYKEGNEPYEALTWYMRGAERGDIEATKQVKELNEKGVWLSLNSKDKYI